MPQLVGDLSFMPCLDVLRYLADRRLSGKLSVRRKRVEKSLEIVRGAAVSVASNDPREFLGQILINGGLLTEDEFHRSYQTQLETRVPLGRILTMLGLVGEDDVRYALMTKIRETALDACTWAGGEFSFEAGDPASRGLDLSIDVSDLCREADARTLLWKEFRRALPSGRLRLELVPEGRPASSSPLERRLLDLIDGRRTLEELQLHLHATAFQFYHLVFLLLRNGTLRVVERRAPAPDLAAPVMETVPLPVSAPEPRVEDGAVGALPIVSPPAALVVPPADALRAARTALEAGRFEQAERLAAQAVEFAATAEALAALREAESLWLAELRRTWMSAVRVPSVALNDEQLASRSLSPSERYLLDRMDGSRDLASIVRVSPLRELDALQLVARLVAEGVITLR